MNTREALADILSEAVNIASNFEPSVQPAGNFNTGFHNLFNSKTGQAFADECDKIFTGHDIATDRLVDALRRANDHIHNAYHKTSYLADGPVEDKGGEKDELDGSLEKGKLTRPDLPSDPPGVNKIGRDPRRPDGSFIDPPAHDFDPATDKNPGPKYQPNAAKMEPYKAGQKLPEKEKPADNKHQQHQHKK